MRTYFPHIVLSLLLSVPAFGVSTDPVGAMKVTALGNSDTILSVPLHRAADFEGRINSIASNVITVDGTPDWTADQFVYSSPDQTNTYYVLIASGSKEGSYFTVTANGSSTLTLDLAGDTLDGIMTTVADGTGDILRIIPYWTLNTVFPDGEGVHVSTNRFITNSEVLLPDQVTAGINLAPTSTFFYYQGSQLQGDGWYELGNTDVKANDTVLYPDTYFILRNKLSSSTEIVFAGAVQMSGFALPINTLMANEAQDNFVAVTVPVDVTLTDSNLYESGAFTPTTNRFLIQDQLLVFDNTQVAQNKAPSDTYFYYTGSGLAGHGWYKVGDTTQTVSDQPIFQPGKGYIVRKVATPTPGSEEWQGVPNYLQ